MNVNEYCVPEERFDPQMEFPSPPPEYPPLVAKAPRKKAGVVKVLAFSSALMLAFGSTLGVGQGGDTSADVAPTVIPAVTLAPPEATSTVTTSTFASEAE